MPEQAAAIERALTQLMRENGLDEPSALELTGELLREYPLVRRRGLDHATQRLHSAGMTRESASDAALQLLAFELLGRVSYERVFELMAVHAPKGDVLGICLRAARLRREATQGILSNPPAPLGSRLTRFAMSWLGTR